MEYVQQVLWHEGMFLTPQHFQQADRFEHAQRVAVMRALHPFLWGLTSLQIDQEALSTESFALLAASGIFSDGSVFNLPDADAVPAARPFAAHFPRDRDRLGVHLAAPQVRLGGTTSDDPARPSGAAQRFRRKTAMVRDAVAGGADREITLAVKNLSLVFDTESLEGLTSIKIAELMRSPSGGYALAQDFVPTCIAIGAAAPLGRLLRRMVDICCARASELSSGRRQRTQGIVEFSVSETANYTLLHTLNGRIPGLLHLLGRPLVHPEQLYSELAGLAGSLHTFAAEGQAKDVPGYRHDDLTATFAALDAKLRGLLETNITARYVPLPLTRGSGGIWAAKLNEAVLNGHRIYLSMQSSAPQEKVINQTAQKAKIAASSRIGTLIAQALKGMGITYLAVPPGEIPAQPGCSYFELQRSGDDWDQVVETRSLSIFLPPDFTDLKMEFMAVKE